MTRVLLLVLALGGCSARYMAADWDCRHELGPQPYAAASVFGLAGLAAVAGKPEVQDYNARLHACVQEAVR
jgi:hypothetical protein